MKIIQIAAVNAAIYGLGDNGKLYIWNPSGKNWSEA